MKPRIFASGETAFTGMGLGALPDAISCTVTEELCGYKWRGGEYALEMEYPITGRNYDLIAEERIICADPSENASGWQPFRIYSISRPIGGVVTIKADHISRQLKKITCTEFEVFGPISDALNTIELLTQPSNRFQLIKDGSDYISTYKAEVPRTVYDILCGEESILDQYRSTYPEVYTFDKWNVTLGLRGSDRGVKIYYGLNMTDIDKTSDMTDTITGLLPYWKDDQDVIRHLSWLGTYNDVVLASNWSDYIYKMVNPVDVESIYRDNEGATDQQLATAIIEYCGTLLEKSSVLPANITVKFVSLSDTDQYRDMMNARKVSLGDTVTVKYKALGITEKQRVIKTVYNVLLNRYDSIEIGVKTIDMAGVISKIAKRSR